MKMGGPDSSTPMIALAGEIYDVSKGPEYYSVLPFFLQQC